MDKVNLDPFAVEGRVTAQLFNARTGQQVDEQSGSNFIARAVTERILRVAQRFMFAHQHPTQWDWCPWVRFVPGEDAQGFFQWMLLTDSSMAEAPAVERTVPGTIIGYSNRQTHTDADLRRGIINRHECFHRPTQTRWVMDWATDRGNGTIQSVCWAYTITGLGPLPDMLSTDSTLEWVSGRTESTICSYEGDYWATTQLTGTIVRLSAATGEVLFHRTVSPIISGDSIPVNALSVRGDFIFYIGSDSSLRRHTISTGTTSASLGSVHFGGSLAIIGDIIYIFESHTPATGSTMTIRRYSITTAAFMSSLSIPNLPAGVNTRNVFPMDGNVLRVGRGSGGVSGFYHDIDIATFSIAPLGVRVVDRMYTAREGRVKAWVPSQGTTYASGTMRPASGMLYDVSSMAGNFLLSRIRLSEPIVKTSDRTLKVIYDFNYL